MRHLRSVTVMLMLPLLGAAASLPAGKPGEGRERAAETRATTSAAASSACPPVQAVKHRGYAEFLSHAWASAMLGYATTRRPVASPSSREGAAATAREGEKAGDESPCGPSTARVRGASD